MRNLAQARGHQVYRVDPYRLSHYRAGISQRAQFRGRLKLTKQGEPELRRLLFNAAMQGRRNPHGQPYYKEVDFHPKFHSGACIAT